MSVKHTPGPWVDESELATPTSRQVSSFSRDGNRVLQVVVASSNLEEDARLIAAAPELLDALEKIEQQLDYGQIDTARRIAFSALLKYILHRQSQGRTVIEQKG